MKLRSYTKKGSELIGFDFAKECHSASISTPFVGITKYGYQILLKFGIVEKEFSDYIDVFFPTKEEFDDIYLKICNLVDPSIEFILVEAVEISTIPKY